MLNILSDYPIIGYFAGIVAFISVTLFGGDVHITFLERNH